MLALLKSYPSDTSLFETAVGEGLCADRINDTTVSLIITTLHPCVCVRLLIDGYSYFVLFLLLLAFLLPFGNFLTMG